MEKESNQLPGSVFHDIKPLPKFSPLPLWPFLLLATIAIALFLYWVKRRKQSTVIVAEKRVSPEERARQALKTLAGRREGGECAVRELGTELSLLLREFVEAVCHFPAAELTVKELEQEFRSSRKRELPCVAQERWDGAEQELIRVLKLCERATFAANSERALPLESAEITHALEQSVSFIDTLSQWAKKERERKRTVMSHDAVRGVHEI